MLIAKIVYMISRGTVMNHVVKNEAHIDVLYQCQPSTETTIKGTTKVASCLQSIVHSFELNTVIPEITRCPTIGCKSVNVRVYDEGITDHLNTVN